MLRELKLASLRLAQHSGLSAWLGGSRWRQQRLLILCYHGVSLDDEHLWSPELYMPASLFRTRMALLAERCTVLPLSEALERLDSGTLPQRSAVVTFDDGNYDFYCLAHPVLREFRIPATVYVTTYYSDFQRPVFDVTVSYMLWRARGQVLDWPDVLGGPVVLDAAGRTHAVAAFHVYTRREQMSAPAKDELLAALAGRLDQDYQDLRQRRILHIMNAREISELAAAGVDIQLHTHRHRTPSQRDLFVREIDDNRRRVEELTGRPAVHFCYPSGVHMQEFYPWLRESAVVSATTCEAGLCERGGDPLKLPRLLDTAGMTNLEFEVWLNGLGALLPRR